MTQTLTLRNSIDAWTGPSRPAARFGDTKLFVHSTARTFQFFGRPNLITGSVIVSAKLRVWPLPSSGGSGTVDVSLHSITTALDPNTLTWSSQPTLGALIQTVTRPSWFDSGSVIEFDVTSKMQQVIDGAAWFGWRISSTEVDATQSVYGGQSERPAELFIEYTTPPKPPVNLRPSTNSKVKSPQPVLSWTSPGGYLATQTHVQVQVATNSAFTTGLYTSDQIPSGASSIDLADITPVFAALANNSMRWWRVRIRNDYGLWSGWSTGAQFTYVDPYTVNITVPGATTSDPTPVITWTYSGNQAVFQIFVEEQNKVNTGSLYTWKRVYDSGYQYTATHSFELPVGVITSDDKKYRIILRVWDEGEQLVVTGAPLYSEDIQIFDWNPTGATPPVDLEISDLQPGRPGKLVRWRYMNTDPTPKLFVLRMTRRGKTIVRTYSPAAVRESPTSEWYRTEDWPAGRADIKYEIGVILPSGQGSAWAEVPAVTQRIDHRFPWVVSVYDPFNRHFSLLNPSIDPGLSEVSDLVVPLNGQPFLAMYALQKFNGTASGIISNEALPAYLTADQMLEDFLWIRENPRVFFSWADQAIEAYIYNTAYTPIPTDGGRTDYAVSFNFVQV